MKNYRHIFFTILFALCAFSITTYTSCNSNKCKDIACRNGGSCNDGNCTCTGGYSGTLCEVPPGFCDLNQCQNGGTCQNNVCNCPAGYEGTVCENETRGKFIGNYICLDKITGNVITFQYTALMQAGTQLTQVKIINFANQFTQPVIGNVVGNSMTVTLQEPDGDGKRIQGTAVIDPNDSSLEWVYRIITAADDTIDYDGVWGHN